MALGLADANPDDARTGSAPHAASPPLFRTQGWRVRVRLARRRSRAVITAGATNEDWAPIPWNRGPEFIMPFTPQAPVLGRPGFTGVGSGLTGVGVTVTVGAGETLTLGAGVTDEGTDGVGVGAPHTG